jgi:uncharacterized protein with NRDE domain
MCLIAFAYKVHPQYPLILLANRDEFYNRPTQEAHFWVEEGFPSILAGKDLRAGGTWIGLQKNGRWAALTNFRNLKTVKENAPSRGDLVLDFLKSSIAAEAYLTILKKTASPFNDFNLLLFDGNEMLYYSNVSDTINKVKSGIHGLSNALLDTSWPKVEKITKELETAVNNNYLEKDYLFNLLSNEDKAPKEQLPSTGLPLEIEKAMSSVFIHTPIYGTHCSTLIFIDKNNEIQFIERKFSSNKDILSEVVFNIEKEQ